MTSLFFQESGSHEDATILFVHGGGISSRMWRNELHSLAGYHCLAPDLPGHGQSSHIQPFTLENAVEGLARIIQEQTSSGKASVIAFSVGAVIALGLLASHPERIERLFLSGPTPSFGRMATLSFELLARPLLSLLAAEQRLKLVAALLNLTPDQAAHLRADLEQLELDLVDQINGVVASQPAVSSSLPVLITVGEREIGPVKQRARALVHTLDNAQGFVVRGVGHVWSLEAPDLFLQTIRAWMNNEPMPPQLEPLG